MIFPHSCGFVTFDKVESAEKAIADVSIGLETRNFMPFITCLFTLFHFFQGLFTLHLVKPLASSLFRLRIYNSAYMVLFCFLLSTLPSPTKFYAS